MALRVIDGGKDGPEDDDEAGDPSSAANGGDEGDDEDDGLGSSTILGVPAPPVSARPAGGKYDFDDGALDAAFGAMEQGKKPVAPAIKPQRAPTAPQNLPRAAPAMSTHGSGTSPQPIQRPPTGVQSTVGPATGPMPIQGAAGMTGPVPMPIGHQGTASVVAPQSQSHAALYAFIAVVFVLGGVVAYAVFANRGSGDSGTQTGSGSAVAVGSGSGSAVAVGSGSAVAVGSGSAGSGSAAAAKPANATAELASLEHPVVEPVTCQTHGQVATATVTTPKDVKAGDTLFTIRTKTGANVGALQARVAELEKLAKDDPDAYGPFLASARAELAAAQAPIMTTIKAGSAGLFDAKVKVGDDVKEGVVLGNIVDGRTWIGVANMDKAKPTAAWICTVATPDNSHTAACRIQATEAIAGSAGTRVTVEISATGTAWLDPAAHPKIVLEPPAR